MKRSVMALTALLAAMAVATPAQACDSDGDCGPGGTCIKREKRASGVCYGGRPQDGTPSATVAPNAPAPVAGELRERATQWLGDPEALIEESLPGSELGGTCMVTQDCADGYECVVAGFEGRCVKQ